MGPTSPPRRMQRRGLRGALRLLPQQRHEPRAVQRRRGRRAQLVELPDAWRTFLARIGWFTSQPEQPSINFYP